MLNLVDIRCRILATTVLTSIFFIADAQAGALPGHGHFVSGQGSINKASQSVTVKQSSTTGIIDWNKFSVGSKSSVTFDNGSGATLNRVTGGNLSTIAGSLHATGSLYLMNSSGVIVSGTGRVVTGGSFMATTSGAFGSDDSRFKATGKVINRGTIISGGTTTLTGSDVTDRGTIRASAVTLSATHKLAVDGAVTARNIDGSGGTVTAHAHTIVIGTDGDINASASGAAQKGGAISLISRGTTTIAGTLKAKGGAGGTGGFIETSGENVHVANSAKISTLAKNGKAGTWLIDPQDFTIAASGGDITGATLSSELAGGSIVIKSSQGAVAGNGDIFVDDAVSWSSSSKLTLDAYHSIYIDAAVSGANLSLSTTTGNIDITKPIAMTQNVDLISGEDISETKAGAISAANLSGSVTIVATLNGANAIGQISNFSGGTDFGGIEVTDDETLAVAGIASGFNGIKLRTKGAGHDIIIDGAINDDFHNEDQGVTLDSAGTIIESGLGHINSYLLSGEASGGIDLNGENSVSAIGSLINSGSGGFAMHDDSSITWMDNGIKAGAGNLVLVVAGSDQDLDFGNAGTLTAGGKATLSASGSIDEGQFGGAVNAAALTATAGQNISMSGANKIPMVDSLRAGGSIAFNSSETLTVGAAINTGSFNVALYASGQNSDLILERDITGHDVSLGADGSALQKGGIIAADVLTASAGNNVTLNGKNQIVDILGGEAGDTFAITNARTLTLLPGFIGSDSIYASTIDLTTIGAGHNIVIEDYLNATTQSFNGEVSINSAGTVEQVGQYARIDADSLQGSSRGGAALVGSQNEINTLTNFSNTGGGDLTLTGIGTITGLVDNYSGNITLQSQVVELALAIEGNIETSGTLNLLGKYIEELDNGAIVAKELTADVSGFLGLGSLQNQIGKLGDITAEDEIGITNSSELKVAGTVTSSYSSVSLTTVSGDIAIDNVVGAVNEASENYCCTVQFSSGGGIKEGDKGLIEAQEFAVGADGNVVLNAANRIGSLFGLQFKGGGQFTLTDSDALTVTSFTAKNENVTLITMGGSGIAFDGTAVVNTLTLSSAGGITEAGEIEAGSFSGSASGDVVLGGENQIRSLGNFVAQGAFSLNDATSLTVNGILGLSSSAPSSITTTGAGHGLTISGEIKAANLSLASSGITLYGEIAAGDLSLDSSAKITEIATGALDVQDLSGSVSGPVSLESQKNEISDLGDFSTAGNSFDITDAQALTTTGAIDVGQGTVTIATIGNSSDLSIGGALSGSIVNLRVGGTASESSAGSISAGILNVTAGTGITLTSPNNKIGLVATDFTESGPNEITL